MDESVEEDTKEEVENKQLALCKDVKSTAVVKYSNLQMTALFHELQPNTDLNEPPANWLHGSSKLENYLRGLSLGRDRAFSSFKMAHRFPDQAGDIDVISDCENIKKLLKIPYSKAHVSMIVHRVGATLLLDDFDIHKHLLRQQQDDWVWMREFYQKIIRNDLEHGEKDKVIVKKNKSRDHLQSRDMFSKFLYHSVVDEEGTQEDLEPNVCKGLSGRQSQVEPVEHPTIPDPFSEPRVDQTEHQRTVVWSFEDLRMLIGTDLPIFGGKAHPCVSLRLRDSKKPINVLTGLDYWLDNLMCNVPELAMCYHLNGIVQSYELMKTEDIPNIEDSKFAPSVVKDIAQNILSFLKSNATKEGHTYWLFKGHGDDVVKLYDLTTLTDGMTSSDQNPFMVPVGILLYRVARNMRQNSGRKKSGTIRTLLENCLMLLSEETHPQVVTSAHYLLSDLYISDNIYNQQLQSTSANKEDEQEDDDNDPDKDDEDDEHEDQEKSGLPQNGAGEEKQAEEGEPTSVAVQALCIPQEKTDRSKSSLHHPPVVGTVPERCGHALKHIAKGLVCLDEHVTVTRSTESQEQKKHACDEQVAADPNVAIPLHFASLSKARSAGSKGVSSGESTTDNNKCDTDNSCDDGRDSPHQVSVVKKSMLPSGTWHALSKTLLLRKATVAYLALAEYNINDDKHGEALRNLKMAASCFCAMRLLTPSKEAENKHVLVAVLGLAGDAHLMLSRYPDQSATFRQQFEASTDFDCTIQRSISKNLTDFEYGWLSELSDVVLDNLKRSVLSYEVALDVARDHSDPETLGAASLSKRLGNVQNELGVQYMNMAAASLNQQEATQPTAQVQQLWQSSYTCLVAGIAAFDSLNDHINAALLHCNCGRLMRLCARAYAGRDGAGQPAEMNAQERHFYAKAVGQYERALDLLKEGPKSDQSTEIVSSVTWELSSTYYTWAITLQDRAPLSSISQEEVEKDVTDLMMKALKYCDSDNNESVRQASCQYRAATTHHRLGSLYHNAYRNQMNEQKKKHQRTLADLHYGKASRYFSLVDSPCEVLRVQLERVALCEYHLTNQSSSSSRMRSLQTALGHLVQCRSVLDLLQRQLSDQSEEAAELLETYREELSKLAPLFGERLASTLLNIIRCMTPSKKSKVTASPSPQLISYKTAYSLVIKANNAHTATADLPTRCRELYNIVRQVAESCNVPEQPL